ncbi:polysaccharide pyruvyl transferase family protein [Clostridium sp. MSJ-11]|uniref:Polysaccharide pyruvyl transferase family protein n=1 Tax=Clostridium mobile TaxID=2841512 RepID=A0ABS6EKM0_9CLOT|nr:polysaccharide pyruvyl transferase family protein [Clostridium mobile]MBU5485763.1 polysaccharide pyruvyl transferase family protein [Clostridium mobile]
MKKFGIVSYNIHCNFTNYGSALQSWALHQAVNKIGNGRWQAVLVDYCPEILKDKNALNPMVHMWDTDTESRKMCELSLPAIRENYKKFDRFYHEKFCRTAKKYIPENFNQIVQDEALDGFICGSDTIFCIDEFGFDDGYYANYSCMKNGYSVSYAASFGDAHFTTDTYKTLNERLQNFKAIALRESKMVPYVQEHTSVPVQQVVDPTLLLTSEDYDKIVAPKQENDKYLLLYARRYNPKMEAFAEKMAAENGWKIIEISLRATNAERHRMFYEAGVEEFLSLVKYAEFIVTNSFHGMIFSVQYRRPFYVFSREQCDTKIIELLGFLGLSDRLLFTGEERDAMAIDYLDVHNRISQARNQSIQFLENELSGCE